MYSSPQTTMDHNATTIALSAEQEGLMQQFRSLLIGLGEVIITGMYFGEKAGVEQSEVFAKCRTMLTEQWKMAELKAANFCRLAMDEYVFDTTGKHHYAPSELEIIYSRAL